MNRMEMGTTAGMISGLMLGLIAGMGAWRLTHLLSLIGAALVGFVLGRISVDRRDM